MKDTLNYHIVIKVRQKCSMSPHMGCKLLVHFECFKANFALDLDGSANLYLPLFVKCDGLNGVFNFFGGF